MYVQSALIGVLFGFFYGLFFVLTRRVHFSKMILVHTLLSVVRIATVASFFAYLLRFTSFHFTLVLIAFVCTFWFVIITSGNKGHGRHKSTRS